MKTFFENWLETEDINIEQYLINWDDSIRIYEYLGFTEEEYEAWKAHPINLEAILLKKKTELMLDGLKHISEDAPINIFKITCIIAEYFNENGDGEFTSNFKLKEPFLLKYRRGGVHEEFKNYLLSSTLKPLLFPKNRQEGYVFCKTNINKEVKISILLKLREISMKD